MNQRSAPDSIRETDGPFTYEYVAVFSTPGLLLPENSPEQVQIYSRPDEGVEAFLTNSAKGVMHHFDRSNAIATLLLSGFRGSTRYGKFSVAWHKLLLRMFGANRVFNQRLYKEIAAARGRRFLHQKAQPCYLIYRATGSMVEPFKVEAARKFGLVGFGIDAIKSDDYRESHKPAIQSIVAALSVRISEEGGFPNIQFLDDIVFLNAAEGLRIYLRGLKMGRPTVFTSSILSEESFSAVNNYISLILLDKRIKNAVALFVQAQHAENDNLRAFIAAWSGLELLINGYFKTLQPAWESMLDENSLLPNWDRRLDEFPRKDYRLRDKFFMACCVLNIDDAENDSSLFIEINNCRNRYYHSGEVNDIDLPTADVLRLFLKYLGAGVSLKG